MKSFALAAVLAVTFAGGAAYAAVVPQGEKCGNKYISLTQDSTELSAAMCQSGNSTGGPNSPIGKKGWTDLAESKGGSSNGFSISTSTGEWSYDNAAGYTLLGISIKQGNGFAFYVLDLTKALTGFFYTGNKAYPTGHDLSHANIWSQGDPAPQPAPIPLPATVALLPLSVGALAMLRRRRKAA